MSRIVIDIEGLAQNSNNIAKRTRELQDLNRQLETIIQSIESTWEGEASRAYVRMMQNYLKQGKQMEKVLQEFKNYADNASSRFSEKDRALANKIHNAF